METKICSKCNIEKPLMEFTKRPKTNSYYGTCKECKRLYAKEYRQNNNGIIKEKRKRKYQENIEELRAKGRKYYYENKEKISERNKKYYYENSEELNDEETKMWAREVYKLGTQGR